MTGVRRLSKKILSGSVGFSVEETMSGHHRFVDGKGPPGQHPMEFNVRWGPSSIISWINPFGDKFLRHPLSGTVTVGGLCEDEPVRGYMELRYLTEQKIRYAFNFNVDEVPYRFYGEKRNLRPYNLHRTHTTLYGSLTNLDADEVLSESTLFFYLSTLPSMLTSFRFQ